MGEVVKITKISGECGSELSAATARMLTSIKVPGRGLPTPPEARTHEEHGLLRKRPRFCGRRFQKAHGDRGQFASSVRRRADYISALWNINTNTQKSDLRLWRLTFLEHHLTTNQHVNVFECLKTGRGCGRGLEVEGFCKRGRTSIRNLPHRREGRASSKWTDV